MLRIALTAIVSPLELFELRVFPGLGIPPGFFKMDLGDEIAARAGFRVALKDFGSVGIIFVGARDFNVEDRFIEERGVEAGEVGLL